MDKKIDNAELKEYPLGASSLAEAVGDFEASATFGFGRPASKLVKEMIMSSGRTLVYVTEFKIGEANLEIYGYKFKRLFRKSKIIPIPEKEKNSVKYNLTNKLLSERGVELDNIKFIY